MKITKHKKFLFSNLALMSIIVSPLITLISCSSNSNIQTIEEFLLNNKNNLITSEKDVRSVPTKWYMDNSEISIDSFEINKDLQKIMNQSSITADFNYSNNWPDGDRIRFEIIFFQGGKKILETESIMSNFISRTEYNSKSKNYLQSLSLNDSIKNQLDLKEFIESYLPGRGEFHEWNNLLNFIPPLGYNINFNDDISSFKYDSKNQKLIIGSFDSTISFNENSKEDLAISITNNFKNPTKPLFVFVVDDNGVDTNILNTLGVNGEVAFVNRTTNNIIKFNQRFNGKAIYGDLDFSNFQDWELPLDSSGLGFFQDNFITSIKLPLNTYELPSRIFYNNKITIFDTNNMINHLSHDSFDSNVKYGDALLTQLGLRFYYNENLKTIDFSKNNDVMTLDELMKLLQLVLRNDNSLLIENIILPAEIFNSLNINIDNYIRNLNDLQIEMKTVELISNDKITLNNLLTFRNWKIDRLIIPKEIIAINISSIKNSVQNISRELHSDIKNLVINGVLDLRNSNTINELLNYNSIKNLNNYFGVDKPEENLIKTLYLENSDKPTSSNFHMIFKTQNENNKNKIYISNNTHVVSQEFINTVSSSLLLGIEIEREIPSNLNIQAGHLLIN
ncbi:MAG: hypothetical protein ACRC63_00110, partial [Metamycoplasmataceae bacterium]